jgi:DNA repair protein RadC
MPRSRIPNNVLLRKGEVMSVQNPIESHRQIPFIANRFQRFNLNHLNQDEREWIISTAISLLAEQHKKGDSLNSPQATKQYLQLLLADRTFEVFGMLFLDNQHRVIVFEELFQGTIDGTSVYPRVVVERALLNHTAAVIATHNHPAGVCNPSNADRQITRKLQDALALLDIRFLDHIIVASEGTYSFAENGLL